MYSTQAEIADNAHMRVRVAQAAAQEGALTDGIDADAWAAEWRRAWASAPGWSEAWESAVAGGVEAPGLDPAVITDGMILSQVQSMKPFGHVGGAA